jgi:uncharacterized protein with ParB-like and HNH nuclease domain
MAEKDFVTNLLTIEDVVNNRLFKIPDYQRGYSWESHQVEDLIKDIEHVSDHDHKHYTGTIVVSKSINGARYEVVDGQQRLTTLIILLKEINQFDPDKYKELFNKFLIREDGEYILETNLETKDYFKDAIIGDKKNLPEEIKSLQNLQNCKSQFHSWLKKKETDVDSVLKVVLNQLGFLCFAPENSKEIGIMFEVINNRGKALSELEKIKNYFIYYATIKSKPALREKVNRNWGKILQYLSKAGAVSNNDENNYLRNCYIVYYSSNKKKSWHAYDELKLKYKPDDYDGVDEKIDQISDFVDFLEKAAQAYAYFHHADSFKSDYNGEHKMEIAALLNRLRCHPVNASIFPLYLSTMAYLYDKPNKVVLLLKAIEITNFRVYVLPNPRISRSDSNQGDMFHWAKWLYWNENWHSDTDEYEWETYLERPLIGDVFDNILMQLEDFTKHVCPESVFVESLTVDTDESIDYYKWNGIRFLLASYEEYKNASRKETWPIERILISRNDTKREKGNDYLSREHIWAVKNRKEHFPENYIDKRRLGNFVLLGLSTNIQLQKDDIHDKVKFLIGNSSISMIQVNDLKKYLERAEKYIIEVQERKVKNKYYYQEIATSLIDQRETDLVKFALKRWSFEGEKMGKFLKVDTFEADALGRKEKYFLKEKKN